nr:microcephalin [Halyomorpha halys]
MLLVLFSVYIILYISILKMASTLLCSWNNEDWGNISGNHEDKSDSETCSTLEDSGGIDKPVVITNDHIALPDLLQQSTDSEDIFTKLLGATSKQSQNDDNSEEMFNSHKKRNIKADLNRRNMVEKVFEKYDDPYAKFPVAKTPKTPGVLSPKYTLVSPTKTPPSNKPWKYVTLEEREARRRAAIEGQRDFCQVLIKKGIDPEDYVSSVFKSTKKSGSSKKFTFECSTPKTDTFSECVTTPFTDRSNVNTPISGIKKLPMYCGETSFTPNYINCSLTSRCSDLSLNETYSPVHDLPPETKSTLLSGLICYVDVRSANEDMTASVQEELLTLGARIEKNFTKKVTHVVFKEGRMSTYLKAKKEDVPLVSVLWIEACKRVRGVADPALHPPRRMEKYENILPFQTLKSVVNTTPVKRPRTKATASRQLVKVALARKRGNNKIKTDPDDDDCGSSPSTFVDDKANDSHKNKKHIERRSIVFTSVHRSELPKYVEKVKELGRCVVENEVTKKTTHVVCNGPRRTLNLIKGIARGCWILDLKWFEESVKEEKWLPEDKYILSKDFPCITECCRERRGLRTSHVVNIFKDLGRIYVSKAANPPKKDLDQLLKMCCAKVSRSSSSADITIGGNKPNPNPDGIWVSEKWIIDSITHNSLQPYSSYTLAVDNKIKETADTQQ